MRLRLLIEDVEYREALKDLINSSYRDVYVEILDVLSFEDVFDNTIIVTDIDCRNISPERLSSTKDRIIFLTNNPLDILDESINDMDSIHKLFMYRNINIILSEISEIYYHLNGSFTCSLSSYRKLLVCGDSTDFTRMVSNLLARQIRFRHGGKILLLSLTYINSFPVDEECNSSSFSKMMYYRELGRNFNIDLFTFEDNYDISYLRLPLGFNPLAHLDNKALISLIDECGFDSFETIIIDIGSEFSERNLSLFDYCDNALFCDSGKRSNDWDSFYILNDENIKNKSSYFSADNIEMKVDNFVRELYGASDEYDEESKRDSKKIQKRDRQNFLRSKEADK